MNNLMFFYKMEDGQLMRGSGFIIPEGFIQYQEGKEPEELLLAIETQEKKMAAEAKKNNILQELKDLDFAKVRPLSALHAGVGSDEDKSKIAALEEKTKLLREQLREITNLIENDATVKKEKDLQATKTTTKKSK